MTPADSKDWFFAAVALTTAASAPALAVEEQKAGVVTGTVSTTRVTSGALAERGGVVLGDNVRAGEEFRTGPDGIIHILFLDQSSITLGPNSRLSIDVFSHDAATRTGKIRMSLYGGSVRVVGGMNSKSNETEVQTPGGVVGISGGISIVESQGSATSATFLFGQSMRVNGANGDSVTVMRPGFTVTTGPSGVSSPTKTDSRQLAVVTGRFETRAPAPAAGAIPDARPPVAPPAASPNPIATAGQAALPSTMAPDRLSNPSSTLVGAAMGRSQPNVVTVTDNPPPVTTVRTLPPVAAS